ncbi:MAG: DUF2523 family protein [Thiohalocapsa sp.]
MAAFLVMLASWFLASVVARMLLGAGLAFVTADWVSGMVDEWLGLMATSLGSMGGIAADILYIAGAGVAFDYFGTGVVCGVTVWAAKNIVGLAIVGAGAAGAAAGAGD